MRKSLSRIWGLAAAMATLGASASNATMETEKAKQKMQNRKCTKPRVHQE